MWKKIRILCLLMILLMVAVNTWRDQNQDWNQPIFVLLHPINADGQALAQNYIQQLSAHELTDAQAYLKQMSTQYRSQPISFFSQMGRELKQIPPKVTENANLLDTILWS